MIIQNEASQCFRQSLQQSVSNYFGDYEVGNQINHGGFGHIFKLKELKSKRVYALKVLQHTNKGQQPKIKNQINIHQSLKNRYILQMNNKFHDCTNYYMVLEYCEKGDLFTNMVQNYPNFGMPIQEVRNFAEQIAKGISYIHKQDIIHGDIKPSNILISQKDEIKICDFGLSTKRKNKEKVKGVKGTLNYLAPQCVYSYDQKIDVWAFGVLVYFLSTGTLPFQISNYKQLTQLLTEQRLEKFNYPEKMPIKLKDLFRNIFVYDPVKRYSINEVLSHPFMTGEDLVLRKPTEKNNEIAPRMRSQTSTSIEGIKKSDSLKTTLDFKDQNAKYHSKRSRPTSTNKDYDSKKAKQSYMTRILEKKTKMMQKQSDLDKQNNVNTLNTNFSNPKHNQNQQKNLKLQKKGQKIKENVTKKFIQPLNTQGMIIKPIVQKNCITKINSEGICRLREETDQQNKTNLKEIKISPDGKAIFMKLNKIEKFYTIQNLPEKYFKEYQNCKKIVNSVKNHTSKLQYSKKIHTPIYKDIRISVMYNGKVFGQINGKKIEATERELQEDFVTFAQNGQKFISEEQYLKYEIKYLYQRLMAV